MFWLIKLLNPFQPRVAFHIETSHSICSANQTTGICMKCNTGVKRVKGKPGLGKRLVDNKKWLPKRYSRCIIGDNNFVTVSEVHVSYDW